MNKFLQTNNTKEKQQLYNQLRLSVLGSETLPQDLNTIKDIITALNNDSDFYATIQTDLSGKIDNSYKSTAGQATASKLLLTNSSSDMSGLHDVGITNDLTLSGHNGVDHGLILGSMLLTASISDLNKTTISVNGTCEANKCVITDSNKDITGIRNITLTTLNTGSLNVSNDINMYNEAHDNSRIILYSSEQYPGLQEHNFIGYGSVDGGENRIQSSIAGDISLYEATSTSTSDKIANFSTSGITLNATGLTSKTVVKLATDDLDTSFEVHDSNDNTVFTVYGNGACFILSPFELNGFTRTAEEDGQDINISLTGNYDASLLLSSTGTGDDAISLTTSAGGIIISSASTLELEDSTGSCTATMSDLNKIDITTDGTVEGNKCLISDENKDISGLHDVTISQNQSDMTAPVMV